MNDNTRQLSPAANDVDLKALTLLARVQGVFAALNQAAEDGKVRWPNKTTDALLSDIDAYVFGEGGK